MRLGREQKELGLRRDMGHPGPGSGVPGSPGSWTLGRTGQDNAQDVDSEQKGRWIILINAGARVHWCLARPLSWHLTKTHRPGPGTHGDSGRDDRPGAEQGTERESDSRNGSEKWVWAEGLSSLEQIH